MAARHFAILERTFCAEAGAAAALAGQQAGWGAIFSALSDSCAWRSTVKSRGRRRGRACTRRQYYLLGSEGIRRCAAAHLLPRDRQRGGLLTRAAPRRHIAQPYGRTPGCRGVESPAFQHWPRTPAQHQQATARAEANAQSGPSPSPRLSASPSPNPSPSRSSSRQSRPRCR